MDNNLKINVLVQCLPPEKCEYEFLKSEFTSFLINISSILDYYEYDDVSPECCSEQHYTYFARKSKGSNLSNINIDLQIVYDETVSCAKYGYIKLFSIRVNESTFSDIESALNEIERIVSSGM